MVPPSGVPSEAGGAGQTGEQQHPPPKPPEGDADTTKQRDSLLEKVGEAIRKSSAATESSAQDLLFPTSTMRPSTDEPGYFHVSQLFRI